VLALLPAFFGLPTLRLTLFCLDLGSSAAEFWSWTEGE
jgi:hypothetical protein